MHQRVDPVKRRLPLMCLRDVVCSFPFSAHFAAAGFERIERFLDFLFGHVGKSLLYDLARLSSAYFLFFIVNGEIDDFLPNRLSQFRREFS